MNRKLVSGTVAGLAAIALATGGGTFAAFDQAADIGHNRAGAGVLQLDLAPGAGAATTLSFAGLLPGQTTGRLLWVAANDARSVGPAELALTVHRLVDVPGRCDVSQGKAQGDIDSGIGGCAVSAGRITGTPSTGVLSRLLNVRAVYDPAATSPARCRSASIQSARAHSLLPAGAGNLRAAATAHHGAGTTVVVGDSRGPLALAPGHGVCVFVSVAFPPGTVSPADASPQHPVDNAAQGDSLRVEVRFDLTQVAS